MSRNEETIDINIDKRIEKVYSRYIPYLGCRGNVN